MKCPCCLNPLNEPELVDGQRSPRPPREGDVAYCCHCGGMLLITSELTPKMIKDDYLEQVIRETPENKEAVKLLKRIVKQCKQQIYEPLFSNICKN